jgi:hypothetical protein
MTKKNYRTYHKLKNILAHSKKQEVITKVTLERIALKLISMLRISNPMKIQAMLLLDNRRMIM